MGLSGEGGEFHLSFFKATELYLIRIKVAKSGKKMINVIYNFNKYVFASVYIVI